MLLLVALAACDPADTSPVGFRDEHAPADPQGGFVQPPDVGGGTLPCSTYDQDCPAGFKCTYALGGSWERRCVPVVMAPAKVGEPCTAQDNLISGLDDCERGAVCWYVDPRTNLGTCLPYMLGNTNEYRCGDPWYLAAMSSASYPICLPMCNPQGTDCEPGDGCYPVADRFVCAPDASGDLGAAGDPCEFLNVCDPGNVCVDGQSVPGCASVGCCTSLCDTNGPVCPAGQSCTAWYTEGDAPPGMDAIGVCIASP